MPPSTAAAPALAATEKPAVVCESVVRIHRHGSIEVQALQGLDLSVERGEMIAVVGPSGAGKSTLLSILAGSDAPSAGRVHVDGWDLGALSTAGRVRYRRGVVGVVRQQTSRNLVAHLTAEENVAMPAALGGTSRKVRRTRSAELLDRLGVGDCARRLPHEMSGGQQQRVALAVALANGPSVLLADEPTGELDTTTAHEILGALRTVSREDGITVVVVTHDATVSDSVERTVAIRDGRTSSEVLRTFSDDGAGGSHVVAQEYAVMDRAGRVQIPREYREALELTRRVRLALEADHVSLWPDGER
ncbi:ABC transporter [Serinibacter arcticus]|uniref:ABC transporter n=1 Tax=Serinibacter arcticus TaxID=1655435 RepID=A0A2U1ZW78_9MICO|nr:ABC transporter ATP-binding protein [Serinibacter arcticus]PWD51245.1 ABC transporter [Serinibacter arcticus]